MGSDCKPFLDDKHLESPMNLSSPWPTMEALLGRKVVGFVWIPVTDQNYHRKGSRSQKLLICSCGFAVVSTAMGEGSKGARLRSEGCVQGCYSSEPKGSAVLHILPWHQRDKTSSLCCCRSGGSSSHTKGVGSPTRAGGKYTQGAMSPEHYSSLGIWNWSVCRGGMGQGDPHPFSCGLSLLLSQWKLACETAGADYLCVCYGGIITANRISCTWRSHKCWITDISLSGPHNTFLPPLIVVLLFFSSWNCSLQSYILTSTITRSHSVNMNSMVVRVNPLSHQQFLPADKVGSSFHSTG